MSLNNVVLIGRITKDIELKHVGSDNLATARFTLAVNRKFKQDEADFISIVAWRKTAENLAQYCGKGSQIAVVGRIQTGKYDNQEGVTVYTTDVMADDIRFLDTKSSKSNDDPFTDDKSNLDDSDLPF